MPRSVSMPARTLLRAPPPPTMRLYDKSYSPPLTTAPTADSLTLESADGVSFYLGDGLVSRCAFFADLSSMPLTKDVIVLPDISARVLRFALDCAADQRRTRRHSAPVIPSRRRVSPSGAGRTEQPTPAALGPAPRLTSSEPPLVPSGAWEWAFLTQVLTLAFAYDLRHALERLAAHSGEFYDPVLSYTMWSLVDAARGDAELTKGPGVAFPGAGAGPENEASAALLPWAQALLRYDGEIPTWCAHALYTHHPSALDTLEDLLARRQSVNAELAAADERIAGGESKRASKVMWDAPSKRRTFDVLVRRASVTTFFLRVVDNAPPPAPAPAPASLSRRPSRRISLRRKPKLAGNQPCSPECRIALRRTLTAAMALATRQSSSEKFSTVDYYVEYTYEGLQCDSCRHNVQEALVWIWCMKMPWRGGVGL